MGKEKYKGILISKYVTNNYNTNLLEQWSIILFFIWKIVHFYNVFPDHGI
jgi:hypothetical protein